MVSIRAAVPDDAPELVRLRQLMFDAMGLGGPDAPIAWRAEAERMLRKKLADPDSGLIVFVAADPSDPGSGRLAACAVGTVAERLPNPVALRNLVGHVSNVCTDPEERRRGYARACLKALLDWFDQQGVQRVDLNATAEGQGLYLSLGFAEPHWPALARVTPAARDQSRPRTP